jgi:hypothetical protein
MTPEEFNEVVHRRQAETIRILANKAIEYAPGEDRLHNFKRAGFMLGVIPEKALVGMLVKHLVSVFDMVDDLERDVWNPLAQWSEKLVDAINYLHLLEGLVVERYPSQAQGMVERDE